MNVHNYFNEGSIFLAASNNSLTASIEVSKCFFSSASRSNSTTCSIPPDPIITGTPTGAGARFDPPKWLKQGDIIEVEASGVGVLRNTVKDEE